MVPLEYFAAFLDGEGYLALARIRRRRRSPEYCIRVCVSNTNRRVLEDIQATFGGFLSVVGQRRPSWKPDFALIWTNAAASRLIRKVAPYLRVKSRQAAALLEFDDHIRVCRRIRDPSGHLLPLSPRELAVRAGFHNTLKCLNKKGRQVRWRGSLGRMPSKRRPPSVKYLAGFIDAEGCLMITRLRGRGTRTAQYKARVSVGNTDRGIVEDVHKRYGGILTNQPARTSHWKHAFQVVWTDGMVENLVLTVRPHLRLKRKQASAILKLIAHKKRIQQGRRGRYFAPHPDEVVAFRETLYLRMKELNAKGPSVSR